MSTSVSAALANLGKTDAAIVAFNNALKPGYYVGVPDPDGKPPVDAWTRVIPKPKGLPPILTLGDEATQLGYAHGTGLYLVWAAQDAAKVARNKPGDIYHAADTGD